MADTVRDYRPCSIHDFCFVVISTHAAEELEPFDYSTHVDGDCLAEVLEGVA